MFTLVIHAAAPHSDGMKKLGRATPSQTLPRGEGMGKNRVPPSPCSRPAPSQTLLRAEVWGNPVSPSPCVTARPSQALLRAGDGGTGFPHVQVSGSYGKNTA